MAFDNKKGFEFSFGWLFAIIIGAAVIFLAVYFASSLVTQEKQTTDTFAGKQFETLLYPLGTGLENEKISLIEFPVTTKVTFECNLDGSLGEQVIKTASFSTIGKKYEDEAIKSRSHDKYIFSQSPVETKRFLVFVKSFYAPFKIADFIFLIPNSQKYCFITPPKSVKEEFEDFKKQNENFNSSIFVEENEESCPAESKMVCFGYLGDKCYASVIGNKVIKEDKKVYFEETENNALLYAAIFSGPDAYECNLKRLMRRTSELSLLYATKGLNLKSPECGSGLEYGLVAFSNITRALNSSAYLSVILQQANDIKDENEKRTTCPLF